MSRDDPRVPLGNSRSFGEDEREKKKKKRWGVGEKPRNRSRSQCLAARARGVEIKPRANRAKLSFQRERIGKE